MTKEQLDRWVDFARRMAMHCWPTATQRRRKKIIDAVDDYFENSEISSEWSNATDWDGNFGSFDVSVEVRDYFDEYRHWCRREETYGGWFYEQVTSCIRAGFDMAVEQSGGVFGFTAGDLRRMYSGNVPGWITDDRWETPFEQIPDDHGIWL